VLLANSDESVPDEIDRAGGRTDGVIERSGVRISGPMRERDRRRPAREVQGDER